MTFDAQTNCIINVAGRTPYVEWQQRLIQTCNQQSTRILTWTDAYPAKSRTHHQSLYGFKYHAFEYAFKLGFENVLWLDAPCYLLHNPAPIFRQIEMVGYYLIGTETPLWKHCNNRTLQLTNYVRDDLTKTAYPLLSGSFIGLNVCERYKLLQKMIWFEREDYFLSAEEDSKQTKQFPGDGGHRHDESVLSALAINGHYNVTPAWESHFNTDDCIIKSEKTPLE